MRFRSRPFDDEFLRIRLLLVLMWLALGLLGVRLWMIQVFRGHHFAQRQEQQSIRRVRLPGARGRLLDRVGKVLADNRPSYGVAIYLEELRKPGPWSRTLDHVEALLRRTGDILGQPSPLTRADIQAHIRRRLPLPLLAWQDLDEQALARLAEQASNVPGMDVQTDAVRVYPHRNMACHVLGYVGKADLNAEEHEERYNYYLAELVGRAGLEKVLDPVLRGEAGARLLRVDVTGYRRDDLGQRPPHPGEDVMLTLDTTVQQLAEDALSGAAGAVVVIDPRNGDVLGMASSPGFDPNQFVPYIRSADWALLTGDPQTPLMNRAAAGAYAPGSIFKPVTALAALGSGRCTAREEHECVGYYALGRTIIRCWKHTGHGSIALRKALEQSCNVYFFNMARESGAEAVQQEARALGLGRRTGIEVDYESPGLVPDAAWKRRVNHDAWREGDTCNMSIGQGALNVTPLQMAVLTAALANKGRLYRPRLVLGTRRTDQADFAPREPEVVSQLKWKPEDIRVVREGMHDVVMAPEGTGARIRVPGVDMAGKTGTAEFGPREQRKRHAWMIAFAPFDAPRYAVAMVVDEGVSGGVTAAPRLNRLFSGLFDRPAATPPVPPPGGGVG
jgi:penicillin-binding protein 2